VNEPLEERDIVIIGGGLVGAALALSMAEQDLSVTLLEGQERDRLLRPLSAVASVEDVEPRVSAISPASQALLTRLGAWQHLTPARCCAYQSMCVWDGEGTGEIRFDAADLHVPALGHIIENAGLVAALHRALADTAVDIRYGAAVQSWERHGEASTVRLGDGTSLRAQLVAGADGARSRLRQWAGLPVREWDYGQTAIVATVQTEQPHRQTAWQRFSTSGPLAFLPLAIESGETHFVSIVWSQDQERAQALLAMDESGFRRELGEAIEWRLGRIEAVSRRHGFPLRQCHAKDYVAPGLALLGDAAHSIHPLAGQGVNLGFADVDALSAELKRALDRGNPLGGLATLERYQRRRKGENLAMMAAMEGFKRLFAQSDPAVRWLRNSGMRWLDHQGLLKNRLAAQAMGIGR